MIAMLTDNPPVQKPTIGEVVKGDLCTGCGTCVSLCPNEAIELMINDKKGIYVPELNEEKCNNCGICYEVCPGHSVNFKDLNREIFGKDLGDILIGNYTNCYIGHANDYEIRYNSAAGGLVTQLLLFALEGGIIDGALVTRMKKNNPLEPEPFIARTREEIIESSRSKYCPVPANIALKEILESKEDEKFAVVGLPCHIHGIRKAELINEKLKEKIVLHLGILCSINRNFLATEYLLQKFNIKKEDVAKLDYRGGGWMGSMSITLKNGNKKLSPYLVYWTHILRSYFVPIRCTLCSDQSSELADISLGDIWLPEFRDDKMGTSLIISRNKIGERILQNAVLKRRIELINIDRSKVVESQKFSLFSKKSYLNARILLLKIFGKNIPSYNQELLEPKFSAYLHAIMLYLQIYISSKRHLWGLLGIFSFLLGCASYAKKKLDTGIIKQFGADRNG